MGIEDPKLNILDNQDLIMKGEKLTSEIVQNYLTQVLPDAPEDVIMFVKQKFMSQEYISNIIKQLTEKLINNICILYTFLFSSLHDYLLSEEVLATTAKHIGAKELILTEVSVHEKQSYEKQSI